MNDTTSTPELAPKPRRARVSAERIQSMAEGTPIKVTYTGIHGKGDMIGDHVGLSEKDSLLMNVHWYTSGGGLNQSGTVRSEIPRSMLNSSKPQQ